MCSLRPVMPHFAIEQESELKQSLNDYFEALERLKEGNPTRVPKGTLITNDAVSLEAGRVKGSIKRSREVFADLIVAIDLAYGEQTKDKKKRQEKVDKAKSNANDFRQKFEAAIAREMSLLREVFQLKKDLAAIRGGKVRVLPLRPARDGQEV